MSALSRWSLSVTLAVTLAAVVVPAAFAADDRTPQKSGAAESKSSSEASSQAEAEPRVLAVNRSEYEAMQRGQLLQEDGVALAAPALPVVPESSPMMQDIEVALEHERLQLQKLRAEFDRANNENEAIAIQRRIEELKKSTQISLFEIQLRHARERGDEELASQLEQAIAITQNPPRPAVAVDRPVPSAQR